jgi:hypothetical protein
MASQANAIARCDHSLAAHETRAKKSRMVLTIRRNSLQIRGEGSRAAGISMP